MNNLTPHIQFTVEEEENNSLNFLDVKITRTQGQFNLNILKKPCKIDTYVHYYSSHHINIKLGVFSQMFLRAFNVCNNNLKVEIDKIYKIGQNLKYPTRVLKRAESTAYKKHLLLQKDDSQIQSDKPNPDFRLILPFNECFSNIRTKLRSYFNTDIVFNYRNNIKCNIICNRSPINPVNSKGMVYMLKCLDCTSIYWGQTGKTLAVRIKQHKRDVAVNNMANSLARHTVETRKNGDLATGHSIDWHSAREIYKSGNFPERKIVESALISKSFNKNINHAYGHAKVDPYMTQVICENVLSDIGDKSVIYSFI